MQSPQLLQLLLQHLDGPVPGEMQNELRTLLAEEANAAATKEALVILLQQEETDARYDATRWANMAHNIVAVDKPSAFAEATVPQPVRHRVHFLKRSWFRYAAAGVLLVGLGLGISSRYRQQQQAGIARRIAANRHNDAAPGGNKAVLHLADGTTILLDSAANGQLAHQGNIRILKLQDGRLQFVLGKATPGEGAVANQINTITTPRGGQYQLLLPDGSNVWLNAATTFHFPTAFAGSHRQVQLQGEAYFEIARDAAHPFEVSTGHTTVRVLGTHFNVNAYPDETAVTTTLLEGKVQVQDGASTANLLPGYQCRSANGSLRTHTQADTDATTAWKNGQFHFNGTDVATLLRQVSRWYNVTVHYVGDAPAAHLTGEMPRTLSLRQVIEVLQESGIRIWLEAGNQLYVAPEY